MKTLYQNIIDKLIYDYALVDTLDVKNGNMVFLDNKDLYYSSVQGVKRIKRKDFITLLKSTFKYNHFFITQQEYDDLVDQAIIE